MNPYLLALVRRPTHSNLSLRLGVQISIASLLKLVHVSRRRVRAEIELNHQWSGAKLVAGELLSLSLSLGEIENWPGQRAALLARQSSWLHGKGLQAGGSENEFLQFAPREEERLASRVWSTLTSLAGFARGSSVQCQKALAGNVQWAPEMRGQESEQVRDGAGGENEGF